MPSYYEVLQVLPSADVDVIKAAYRILARRYHPDSFEGDKVEATSKMQAINAAYEVLSDPVSRAAYDRDRSNANLEEGFFSEEDDQDAGFKADWELALKFCPDAKLGYDYLSRFSPRLAFSFASYLLDTKRFGDHKQVIRQFQKEFLEAYFGADGEIQRIARQLLLCGERAAAKTVNMAVKVMGNTLESQSLLEVISRDYPGVMKKILFFRAIHTESSSNGINFLSLMGVKASIDFLSRLKIHWEDKLEVVRLPEVSKWIRVHFDEHPDLQGVWKGPRLWES